MPFKLLVPETLTEPVQYPDDPTVKIVRYSTVLPLQTEHYDADGIVVWGSRMSWLRDAAEHLTELKWVQGLAAGSDAILAAGFIDTAVFSSGIGLHDITVAEHSLALILAAARFLPQVFKAQQESRWDTYYGGVEPAELSRALTMVSGSRITIWGYGSIGRYLSKVLQAMGAKVTGVATTRRTEGVVEVYPSSELANLLPETDVLVMILPNSTDTYHAFSADLMRLLPAEAWLVNVGRGATVDQQALIAALKSGQFSGAAIDVTEKEPLPADSELWQLPNVIITPHMAGGRPVGYGKLIPANLQRLLAGKPLINPVKR